STFSQTNCEAPELVALRDKVHVITDPALPESAAKIKVERTTGEPVVVHHDICDPLPMARREEKVRAKAAGLLGAASAEHCWQQIQT
ncbi:unnamed protein product, partial [Discosporangium mesarthrocarpum]